MRAALVAGFLLTLSATASATVDIDTANRGSIDRFSPAFAAYGEAYQVRAFGSSGTRGEVTRNYHIFDLSNLTGTVTAAEITFWHPGENGMGSASYDSPDPSETMTFYEVTTPASDIENELNALTVYDDLGTGTVYGMLTADPSVNTVDASGTFQTISLNPAALAAIQASIDGNTDFLIGGSLTTWQPDGSMLPGGNPDANERIFRGSLTAAFPAGVPATTLTLTGVSVPAPVPALPAAGLVALTAALAAVGALGHLRRGARRRA